MTRIMENGAIVDPVSNFASATVSMWVSSGSRGEEPRSRGAAHTLEHLVTTTRAKGQNLSEFCESLGGRSEAITTPEFTIYSATLPKEGFSEGWDLMLEQFLNPDLNAAHLESERSVVLDEIAGIRSNYSRLIHELALSAIFGDHPLGYPASGHSKDITKLTLADIRREHSRQLFAKITPIVSGGVDEDEAIQVLSSFKQHKKSEDPVANKIVPAVYHLSMDDFYKKISGPRSHILVSWVLPNRSPEDDLPLSVLNRLLGGASTGVLQATFAGKEGEYSCYSYRSTFSDMSVISAYASCSSSSILSTVKRIIDSYETSWASVLNNPKAITRASAALNGSLAIGLESTRMRVNFIGRLMMDRRDKFNSDALFVVPFSETVTTSTFEALHGRLCGPQVTVLEGVNQG